MFPAPNRWQCWCPESRRVVGRLDKRSSLTLKVDTRWNLLPILVEGSRNPTSRLELLPPRRSFGPHCHVRPRVAQLLGSNCLLQQLGCQICVGLRETSTYGMVFVGDDELAVIGYKMMRAFLALSSVLFL